MFLFHSRKTLLHFTHKSPVSLSLHYFSTSKPKHESIAAPNLAVVSDFLTQKHQISPHVASRAASVLANLKNTENPDSVISFLKDNGFSQTQLELFVQRKPQLLAANLNRNLKPKFKFFKDFGFSDSEIAAILSKSPWILHWGSSRTITPALVVLKGLLGSNAEVAKLLMHSGWYLIKDLEKTLVPNIEYLRSCGVEMDQIRRYMRGYDRFFAIKPEEMKEFVDRADRLGADRSSGMFLSAVRVVSQMSEDTWERKLQGFRELGFSEDDIPRMFRKAPVVFTASLEKVKKIKEILLATGKYSMESIVSNQRALMSSVEKMYRPRLSVLGVLESKNLIKEWPALSNFCTMTDEDFYKRYVEPESGQQVEVTS